MFPSMSLGEYITRNVEMRSLLLSFSDILWSILMLSSSSACFLEVILRVCMSMDWMFVGSGEDEVW